MKIKGVIGKLNLKKFLSDNSKNISRNFAGAVVGCVGSVHFQIVSCSSLYLFSRSIGPFQCLVSVNYRVLICCTCHFQSSSFYLGSRVQLCCGEGGTLPTIITSMCGECSQCTDHTRSAPAHSCVCFPCLHCSGSRVLCRALSKVEPVFHALLRSKLLRFRFSGSLQGHRPGWACVLCSSQF